MKLLLLLALMIEIMNKEIIENSIYNILQEIEWYDVAREWLQDTPKRVAKAMEKVFEWYNQKPEDIMTVFENESQWIDQIVWLSNIEFYSFCEHHLLPFFWKCSVYYIPGEKICGISKLARIVNIFARRLQNQERLTKQIADTVEELLKPKWVAVVMEWKHFCMLCRGVEKQNSIMKTSDLRWAFKENDKTRAEFFNLIKQS